MTSIRTRSRRLRLHLVGAAVAQLVALPAMAVNYTWSTGTFPGDSGLASPLGAADTLAIVPGGNKFINSPLVANGAITATDILYFQNGNTLTSNLLYNFAADVGLADGGNNGNFTNNGILRKSGGTGTSAITSLNVINSGTLNVQTGILNFASSSNTFNSGSQFTGAGQASITSAATFNGSFSSQNLVLASGNYQGNAAVANGTVNWVTGAMTGSWSVASGATLNLQSGNYKYVNGAVTNQGTVAASDTLYFQNGNVLTNQGLYNLQGDVGLTDGGNNGQFINQGTLRKSSGTGTSQIASVRFVNGAGGVVDAQAGTIRFDNGNSLFNDGTVFSGGGQVLINSAATFVGGLSTASNLTLAGGATFTGGDGSSGSKATLNGNANWQTGALAGSWEVAAGQTLTLQSGNYKYINGAVTNRGTVLAQDTLYFQNNNVLSNQGLYNLQGDVGLADGGNNGQFINNGTLRKSSGGGTAVISSVRFVNGPAGVIDVQAGSLRFDNGNTLFNAGTQFTGAGQVVVNSAATFAGNFSTANNLTLTGGATFTGGDGTPGAKAILNGNANWQTGALTGSWEVATGRTLTLQSGNYKYINGAVTNLGTMLAQDTLYLQNNNVLSNQGVYDVQGDFGLTDGGNGGQFINAGTLRKSAGTGVSGISGLRFVNSAGGVIEAQTGTLRFDNGNTLFNAGTQFTGAGQVVVNSAATFVGNYSTNNNLTLAGGATFTGGDGSSGSKGVMGGNTNWQTGSLNGTWEVAAGKTLTLQSGNYKYINGTVTNLGTIAATDTLYLQNNNLLSNHGRYLLQGDVGLADGGNNGRFVNTGLVLKDQGTGTSSLAGVAFSNAVGGVVDVRTGTIALPQNFNNAGTLAGVGAFSTNVLTNSGHVAPGATDGSAPSTLTLNGSFIQTASGSFDVGLGDLSHFGKLLVSGTANLDGSLNLNCYAACSFSAGTQLVLLHSDGGLSGTFGSVTSSGFMAGAFTVQYTSKDVVLTITQDTIAAVPEPQSWALMLFGGAALAALARRRQRGGVQS